MFLPEVGTLHVLAASRLQASCRMPLSVRLGAASSGAVPTSDTTILARLGKRAGMGKPEDDDVNPLTPEGCDLRGLEWMPLYGGRLFGSDFDAHATDAEWRAALQLWWAAWNQVPAASLPDDDVALCRLAGFGRDVKAWRKVKSRALYGFALCTDGRLYHRALAAFAIDSWQRRLKDRERKAKYRAQKDQPHNEDGTRTETGTGRGQGVGQPRHGTADEKRQDETGQDATLKTEGADAPATQEAPSERPFKLPGNWQPSQHGRDHAADKGLDPASSTEAFVDYFTEGRGKREKRTAAGWERRFCIWCTRDAETKRPAGRLRPASTGGDAGAFARAAARMGGTDSDGF